MPTVVGVPTSLQGPQALCIPWRPGHMECVSRWLIGSGVPHVMGTLLGGKEGDNSSQEASGFLQDAWDTDMREIVQQNSITQMSMC